VYNIILLHIVRAHTDKSLLKVEIYYNIIIIESWTREARPHTRARTQAEHIIFVCALAAEWPRARSVWTFHNWNNVRSEFAFQIRIIILLYIFILRPSFGEPFRDSVSALAGTDNVPVMIIIIIIMKMYGRTLQRARTRPLNELRTRAPLTRRET